MMSNIDEMHEARRQRAIAEILEERTRQIQEWGYGHDEDHIMAEWVCIISKHLGKLSDAILNPPGLERATIRLSLIKIAAICVAALEVIDRKERRT